jgi:hypothetical protein
MKVKIYTLCGFHLVAIFFHTQLEVKEKTTHAFKNLKQR